MEPPYISTEQPVFTLITVHHCTAENQPQLTALLTEAANSIYRHLPGFASASVHRSLDGVRVTNYAQWRTRAEFEAVRGNPAVAPFIEQVRALISDADAHLYEIAAVVTSEPR
jgi:HD-like signal output (HDOD) protein